MSDGGSGCYDGGGGGGGGSNGGDCGGGEDGGGEDGSGNKVCDGGRIIGVKVGGCGALRFNEEFIG